MTFNPVEVESVSTCISRRLRCDVVAVLRCDRQNEQVQFICAGCVSNLNQQEFQRIAQQVIGVDRFNTALHRVVGLSAAGNVVGNGGNYQHFLLRRNAL
ncbi:hypothetical protein H6F67_22215 [Microcoleus sp. FACHB-1515]|uniref:hypothetical protein n=1 Tax=Cyanophyceae TaxID=3028117 RepID=UPI0016896872|nr:hypothetical protein [Microcoleus sp. FACHB-1515]MBD2092567.1 hypothetical protein [Microcoleus sp. FACHB-1515]